MHSAQAQDDTANTKKSKIRMITNGDDAVDAGNMNLNQNMGMGMSNGSCGHQPPSTMNSEKLEKKAGRTGQWKRRRCLSLDATRCVGIVISGSRRMSANHYWCIVAVRYN